MDTFIQGMLAEVLESIDDVEREKLDSLADSPIYTWGWLKTLEEAERLDLTPRHIAVMDDEGLVAFAPCYLRDEAVFDDMRSELLHGWQTRFLKGVDRTGIGVLRMKPTLLLGPPESFSSRILIDPRGHGLADSIVGLLLERLEEQALSDGARVFGVAAASESDQLLGRCLEARGYVSCLRNANAFLDVRWTSNTEYLASLGKNQRKSYKHEDRCFSRAGLKFDSIEDFSTHAERLSELAQNVYLHHSNGLCPFTSDVYRALKRNMPTNSIIHVALKNGEILDFSLDIRHGTVLRGDHWGGDYSEASRRGHAYFKISYHATVSEAIRRGIKHVEFGPAAWREKAKYGSRFEKVRVYLKATSRLDSWLLPRLLHRIDPEKEAWIAQRTGPSTAKDQ